CVERHKIAGFAMAGLGFALLLFNALGYLFRWDTRSPAASIFGILFLGAGLSLVRTSRRA
ncbi:MAG: hypothetical protein LUQ23_03010, partial [Methanomicrobiales archaeon]|nr:hypothetical protein [Methanomicrobiales archaeon]